MEDTKKEIKYNKKINNATYEVVIYFNKNATETINDKLKRIMLRELEEEIYKKRIEND